MFWPWQDRKHGFSWLKASTFVLMFVPMARGVATGPAEVFADGFAGPVVTPQGARYRPTGVAVGPDGSLYVASDQGEGAVFRILSQP